MAFDETGQATRIDHKVNVSVRAYKLLTERVGFAPEDIIFDPNVFAVATGLPEHDRYALDFIEACKRIKAELPGAKISGGISNVSFSFRGNNPVREAIHAVFLYHAIAAGLDMGIVNAGQLAIYDELKPELRERVEDVILNRRPDATERLLAIADTYQGEAGREDKKEDPAWRDWPEADMHFIRGVRRLTAVDIEDQSRAIRLTDDESYHGWAENNVVELSGGRIAMLIRAELFLPGLQLLEPDLYNNLVTNHALIMIFGMVMPAAAGMANWMIPMMIGAPDMALPRMNNFSFWILPFAFSLLLSTFFMAGGGPAGGWTLYPPLSLQMGDGFPFMIFAIHLAGISSIMGSINVVVTILNMRAPGMTLMKMPLFVWTWLITAFLLVAVMPVLAGAVTMMLMDIHFGTSFFSAAGGGDPVLFQHIFWFFGHPEVYILILPSFGIVSEVLPVFSKKPLFGYPLVVFSGAAIGFVGWGVWAHHMFASGLGPISVAVFSVATMAIAIPTSQASRSRSGPSTTSITSRRWPRPAPRWSSSGFATPTKSPRKSARATAPGFSSSETAR